MIIVSPLLVAIAMYRQRMPTTWPDDALHPDPVADPAGVVELQRDAAPQVAERLLQRKRDAAGDHRRRRDDAREVDADDIHPEEREDDRARRAISTSARIRGIASRCEHALEHEHHDDAREADRDQQQQRLAEHERDRRVGERVAVAREQHEPDEPDAHRDRHVEHVLRAGRGAATS